MDEKTLRKVAFSQDILKDVELSDLIWRKYFVGEDRVEYYNQSGDMSSSFHDIVKDSKRFIYVYEKKTKGFFARYLEEYDILVVGLYSLIAYCEKYRPPLEWKEKMRLIICREGACVADIENNRFMNFNEAATKIIGSYINAVDLCGQYIGNFYDATYNAKSMSQYVNAVVKSGEEARKFCNGMFVYNGKNFLFQKGVFDLLVLAQKVRNKSCSNKSFGVPFYNMGDTNADKRPIYEIITEKQKQIIRQYAARCIQNYIESDVKNCNLIDGLKYCCIVKCGNEYILRAFCVFAIGPILMAGNDKKCDIMFLDLYQLRINPEVLEYMEYLKIGLLYYEKNGINSSIFKHVEEFLADAEYHTIMDTEKSYSSLMGVGWDIRCFPIIPIAMSYMPFFEKLVRFFMNDTTSNNLERLFTYIGRMINMSSSSFSETLEDALGKICFNKKELYKCLCVHRLVMDELKKGMSFSKIKDIKKTFDGNEEYFINMDNDSMQRFLNFIRNIRQDDFKKQSIDNLVHLFGPHNIIGYCNFIDKYAANRPEEERAAYLHYLEKVSVVSKALSVNSRDFQWKLEGEELEKADASLTDAYLIASDNEKYSDVSEKFKLMREEWKKYEYEDENFIVTYPTGPSELVEEGIKLNHCVKDFIESIYWETTTIFFIRKKEAPKKPFYTMEIKDGFLRQCHGANNRNVDECDGLLNFISKYCKNKNIKLDINQINKLCYV